MAAKKKPQSNLSQLTSSTRLWLLVPFIVAGTLLLIGIWHYGVNTPFWDEWEMVPLFQKVDHHTLGFTDIWQQHNEHRIVFPNIILTGFAYVTHWNVKAELLLNFAISLVTVLMLYLFVLSRIRKRSLALMTAVFVAAWFFSPVQFENWLWGWQIEWFLAIAGIVTMIYFLDRYASAKGQSLWLFVAAFAGAIVATFSLGSGILVWPLGLGILALYRQPKEKFLWWGAGFVLAAGAYYRSYHKPAGSPPTNLFLHQPANFVKYVAAYMGRPVSGNQTVAILIGTILILLVVPLAIIVLNRKKDMHQFVPWLCLMALPLMAAFITAVSRLGFGLDQSMASRYTGFSILFYIGFIGLAATLLDSKYIKNASLVFAILVVIAINIPLLASSYNDGRTGFKDRALYFKTLQHCTAEAVPSQACLLSTYPSAQAAQNRIDYLKSKHWGGY